MHLTVLCSNFLVCPHMLDILEQRVLPDIIYEDKDIEEIIAMTQYHKKKQINEIIETETQFVQMSQEPIIIQSHRPSRVVPSNERYNKLHSVFQNLLPEQQLQIKTDLRRCCTYLKYKSLPSLSSY